MHALVVAKYHHLAIKQCMAWQIAFIIGFFRLTGILTSGFCI